MMGYLSVDGARLKLGNWFFEHWLRRVSAGRAEQRP
jgi:hypothetical protein